MHIAPEARRHPRQLTICLCLGQVAFVGFAVQALVTREQPIEGLSAHLADPFGHNIIRCSPCYTAVPAVMRPCCMFSFHYCRMHRS